jgi:hydroxymethylbilane synthase
VTQRLRLATRGSPLALTQSASVRDRLAAAGVEAELVVVETEGDRRRDVPLAELAGRGVFVKEVQRAVLDGRADAAVHSAKDLPPVAPEGLVLVAVPEREDAADALVGAPLAVLPPGATVATGAPRRRALLLAARPDLDVVPLRGNVETRLRAVDGDVDAVVVAMAALLRLGLADRAAERLDPARFVPQVGQGAIAVEAAEGSAAATALRGVDDTGAHRALRAERAFLLELGADCDVPCGAIAAAEPDGISLHGVLLSEDGAVVVRGADRDDDPERAGRALAARLRRELGAVTGPR